MTTAIPARVLLVDDHPLVRAAVRQAIDAPDIEVVGEAGTCGEALDLAAELRPDLVLLDLDLPDRSGFEFLRQVREAKWTTQVVVLTVSGADRDLVEAIRLGASGYITKDVTPEAIGRSVLAARRGELPMPTRLAAAAINDLAVRSTSPDVSAQPTPGTDARSLASLTDREREVLAMISDGRTDRETAAVLGISTRTVEAHVGSILRRLSVASRSEASVLYRTQSKP